YSAKLSASSMSNPQIRKRGMIDMLGINCAISYLQAKKMRIDTKRSVHKIPILFEEFKITDIYYGNYRIDVITLYKEKTIKIPKIHSDVDIMPNFYFIVQIGSKIKEAKMIGFIDSKSVLGCSCDSKYFYPTLDLIFDLKKFSMLTRRSIPSKTFLGKHADCMGLFLKFIDNDLSSIYKSQLIQHLMNCDSCRSRFIDAMEFEKLANNLRHYPNLVKKYENKIKPMPETITQKQANELEETLNRAQLEHIYQDKKEEPAAPQPTQTPEVKLTVENFDTTEKETQSKQSKKVIDTIFNEMGRVELPPIKTAISSKHKHTLIALCIMFVFLAGFALISIKGVSNLQKENDKLSQLQNPLPDDMEDISGLEALYDKDDYNPTHQARLIPKQHEVDDFIIQQPVQTKPNYSPTVSRVSWEVPESLVKKPNYTRFLQLTGKNIKLNLQNDLLLVNDVPVNKMVMVNIKIASNGDIQSVKMLQTSGSPAVDSSINRVVRDTLKYMKPPAHGIIAKPVDASLTIELN
ncbi:TonB C-terminal domain-containing protein, partial [bacterium]|nr:TonB C-terminal domain-containing protein [bacterium]